LNENIYKLKLFEVKDYEINIKEADDRTFEFDTDEVMVEKNSSFDSYTILFFNHNAKIKVIFSDAMLDRIASKPIPSN